MKKTLTIDTSIAETWLKSNWKTLLLIVLGIIALWFLFNRTSGLEKKVSKTEAENIQLANDVKILNNNLEYQKKERSKIKEAFTADSLRLISLEAKLEKLKIQKNEKINSIDRYTLSDLDKFFSERYPE